MQSTVRRGGALLLASGLIACGDRSSSQPATSTAQPAAVSQRSALTGEELTRRTVERRAIEAINWGLPAVNEDLMLQAIANVPVDGFWSISLYNADGYFAKSHPQRLHR